MKTTLLGGILFLAPIAVLAIVLGKVFSLSMRVVQPIDAMIPIETVAGIASANVLAIALILVLCYGAGLLAKRAFISKRMQRLDGLLIDMIPGYAVFKGMVGGMASEVDLSAALVPVLVRFDDYEQIAFETEKAEGHSVVFLPGAPSAWSGSTVVVEAHRVHRLDIPTHQVVRLMRVFGRGTLARRQTALGTKVPQGDARPATP